MTSDGISTEDWDRVHALAADVVNASDDDTGERAALRAYLEDLTVKYGELPSILATKADFSLDAHESEILLQRAFDLAITMRDSENLREISLSLADLYVQLADFVQAARWLELAAEQLEGGNESDRQEFQRIESELARARTAD